MPTTMKEAMQNAFEPYATVKVLRVNSDMIPTTVLFDIHKVLKYKYETMLDSNQGVIYIGKKV